MQGVELVKDRKTKEPAPELTTRLFEATNERGLLIGKGASTATSCVCRRR